VLAKWKTGSSRCGEDVAGQQSTAGMLEAEPVAGGGREGGQGAEGEVTTSCNGIGKRMIQTRLVRFESLRRFKTTCYLALTK